MYTLLGIDHIKRRVVSDICKQSARRIKRARMHPTTIERRIFDNTIGRVYISSPWRRLWFRAVHIGHMCAEYSALEISTASCDQNIVRMPVQAKRCWSDLFLDVLGYPEVLILLEIAHANAAVSTANSEFFFFIFLR